MCRSPSAFIPKSASSPGKFGAITADKSSNNSGPISKRDTRVRHARTTPFAVLIIVVFPRSKPARSAKSDDTAKRVAPVSSKKCVRTPFIRPSAR